MNLPTYMGGVLFTKAHKLVRIRVYEVLEKYDLNPTYWSILGATMQASEGIRLTTVATQLGIKPPMVTTEATELIKRGLIRRIAHHSDGRAKLLVITPKGSKLANTVEAELNTEVGRLLSGLSREEIAVFQKTLQVIIDNSVKNT
jgi:DNA-binding MarR family transcriptional regulator